MTKVVLVVGFPACGKSTVAEEFKGWERLNRDLLGGSVSDLIPRLGDLLRNGKNVVLDNLFTKASDRKPFIDAAKKIGARVECYWIGTSPEDSQFNACWRMYQKFGKILRPADMKAHAKDPNTFPPVVFFKAKKEWEKPITAEGFDEVKKIAFKRQWASEYKNKAILLDYDGTLRESKVGNKWPTDPTDIKILPNRTQILKEWEKKGYILCGASNQSGIAKDNPTEKIAVECFERTNKMLGVAIDYMYDSSRVPPVSSWLRKPMPGMGVHFIGKYKLNPAECIMVGDMTSDKTFAGRCGFQYQDAKDFFK